MRACAQTFHEFYFHVKAIWIYMIKLHVFLVHLYYVTMCMRIYVMCICICHTLSLSLSLICGLELRNKHKHWDALLNRVMRVCLIVSKRSWKQVAGSRKDTSIARNPYNIPPPVMCAPYPCRSNRKSSSPLTAACNLKHLKPSGTILKPSLGHARPGFGL